MRRVFAVLAGLTAALIAATLAVTALLQAASVTSSAPLLLTIGAIALALGSLGAGYLFARIGGKGTPRAILGTAAVVFAELAILGWFFLLRPSPYSAPPPPHDEFVQYWNLPTGSRIAYERSPAQGVRRSAPIVWLHGGPGLPLGIPGHAGASGERILDRLSEDGFDVYYVDQIGSGRSARLADPREYTVARHVADLEAIRRAIVSERLILIGLSWGSTLAAAYLAEYPDRVRAVVFESPGPIWWPALDEPIEPAARARSPARDTRRGELLAGTRVLFARLLARRNPRAMRSFFTEEEIDGLFYVLSRGGPSAFCTSDADRFNVPSRGIGGLVQLYTAADARAYPDPRAELSEIEVPALVLRGECDFVVRDVADEIVRVLPRAELVHIERAGHLMQFEQPERYITELRSFLGEVFDPEVVERVR